MMSVLLLLLMTLTSTVASKLSSTTCGVRPLDSARPGIRSSPETFGYNDEINKWVHSEGKIVGGDTAAYGSVPWQGRITRKSCNDHYCGFVILNEFWLLSAAHCFFYMKDSAFEMIVGDYSIREKGSEEQRFDIDKVFLHGNYGPCSLDNDIALIRIKPNPGGRGIQYGYTVRPICLPEYNYGYEEGTNCTVSGWGSMKQGDPKTPDLLRIATVPLFNQRKCKKFYLKTSHNITRNMVCAGYTKGEVDSCQGDSGGPLIGQINGVYTSLGIVSWGEGCALADYPGVYTRVSIFVPWIEYTINSQSLNKKQRILPSKP